MILLEQDPSEAKLSINLPDLNAHFQGQTQRVQPHSTRNIPIKPLQLNFNSIVNMPQFDENSKRGMQYGGYGGLLVAEHYRRMQELEEERLLTVRIR